MGFTLIHRKDGKEIPIKMSIWDAFHGVPNPKPRKPTPCKCCGKTHTPKKTDNDAKKAEGTKGLLGESPKSGNDENPHSYSTSPSVEWTVEDDAKIMEMKSRAKVPQWSEIAEACGGKGTKSQINDRYKELKQTSSDTGGVKSNEEKKKGEDKEATKEQKKADSLARQDDEGKGGKKKKGKGQGQAEEQMDGKADGKKANGSNDVKAWADGFEKKKWVAVASKHYDKTGERITPEQARKMAEEKS